MSLPELELSHLAGSSAGEGVVERHEGELSQVAGSSAGEGVERREEELSQLAASSGGEGVERQEEEDEDLRPPAAAAAVPLVSIPDTADRSVPELNQLAGSSTGERGRGGGGGGGERHDVEAGVLEANNLCARVFIIPNPMATRYVYAALFAMMTIVAWIMRDIELSRFKCDGSHDCLAANGVLRASMALAIIFSIMFMSTVKTRKRYELGNFWNCQLWIAKAAIFVTGCGVTLKGCTCWSMVISCHSGLQYDQPHHVGE